MPTTNVDDLIRELRGDEVRIARMPAVGSTDGSFADFFGCLCGNCIHPLRGASFCDECVVDEGAAVEFLTSNLPTPTGLAVADENCVHTCLIEQGAVLLRNNCTDCLWVGWDADAGEAETFVIECGDDDGNVGIYRWELNVDRTAIASTTLKFVLIAGAACDPPLEICYTKEITPFRCLCRNFFMLDENATTGIETDCLACSVCLMPADMLCCDETAGNDQGTVLENVDSLTLRLTGILNATVFGDTCDKCETDLEEITLNKLTTNPCIYNATTTTKTAPLGNCTTVFITLETNPGGTLATLKISSEALGAGILFAEYEALDNCNESCFPLPLKLKEGSFDVPCEWPDEATVIYDTDTCVGADACAGDVQFQCNGTAWVTIGGSGCIQTDPCVNANDLCCALPPGSTRCDDRESGCDAGNVDEIVVAQCECHEATQQG